ncbi:MAG TPA: HemK/PrmC family methyltransferase [Solirubrobacter sp.]|nr:HemK/PrmC family methyltransferase [Solirubrobacter sp.]
MPDLVELLARNGFVAPDEEAAELTAAAGGDAGRLEALVARRLTGEPLAWITGSVEFCGLVVHIDPGVYVPRWQTEPLALQASELLPEGGVAVDLCTGSGALACVLRARRPSARVVASDVDPRAVGCAAANGVEAYLGDLFEPLPAELRGRLDVVAGVVPYVPTPDLPLLQRDTFTFETPLAYDGGPDGTALLRRAVRGAGEWLRPGGVLALELGGRQAELLRGELAGFDDVQELRDEDGDVRGITAARR